MPSRKEEILEFVTRFPGRDDDEISKLLTIFPRQAVNVLCRRLQEEGLILRRKGPRGKIINIAIDGGGGRTSNSNLRHSDVASKNVKRSNEQPKPKLFVQKLIEGGFKFADSWKLSSSNKLEPISTLPATPGVYAFATGDVVQYVGIASSGIRKRLRFYARPGITQRTSQRLNQMLILEISRGRNIDIYIATPPDFYWGDLLINGNAGLEVGLIRSFHLPWNIRGAKQSESQ